MAKTQNNKIYWVNSCSIDTQMLTPWKETTQHCFVDPAEGSNIVSWIMSRGTFCPNLLQFHMKPRGLTSELNIFEIQLREVAQLPKGLRNGAWNKFNRETDWVGGSDSFSALPTSVVYVYFPWALPRKQARKLLASCPTFLMWMVLFAHTKQYNIQNPRP